MQEVNIRISKRVFLDIYKPLINSDYDIELLYGGRDSGKSMFIAQLLVYLCLKETYFRCVLVRKVASTIKESQWQTIKDVVTKWGLQDEFEFIENPLTIRCKNGNRFICRGMDEPGKLKSIANPSHCWAEEVNQMDNHDFITIMTSLRYNDGKVKTWFSFNPEADGDYKEHWLYKTFYSTQSDVYAQFTSTWSINIPNKITSEVVQFRYRSTHSTYHDNKHCRPERKAFLEHVQDLDPYYYMVFTLGRWGNRKNDDPFCYCFSKAKHTGRVIWDKTKETILSFDFNVNPITCGVYQHHAGIRAIKSIKLKNSDIYKLCDHINGEFPNATFLVTGDATGKNTTALVQDGINFYTVIKNKLNLSMSQLKVPTVNPRVADNRVLVNAAFSQEDVLFDKDDCKELIFDCENVAVNDIGEIDKGNRANPKKRADHLDHFRYYLNTFHKHILKM